MSWVGMLIWCSALKPTTRGRWNLAKLEGDGEWGADRPSRLALVLEADSEEERGLFWLRMRGPRPFIPQLQLTISTSSCRVLILRWHNDISSVAQSYPTLCDPMDCNTPGFPVPHQLPELAQTHVHQHEFDGWWCHPTVLSSVIPFSSCLQSFPASGSFLMSQLFTSGGQSIGISAQASVLPMNTQDWFPLQLTGLISLQSKGPRRSSPTPQFKSISSSALSFVYGPSLTSIHNYRKNHSFDYMDLCWQSNVSAF